MPTRRDLADHFAPVFSRLLLSAGLLFSATSAAAIAGERERKIEISSVKTDDGHSSVTVIVTGIPPEELGEEGLKALLKHLAGGRTVEALLPQAKAGEALPPQTPGGERDQKQFDLELNIHWKRTVENHEGGETDTPKPPHGAKEPGKPKLSGEPKSGSPAKVGEATFDSIKKALSGGSTTSDAQAPAGKPVELKAGERRQNAAEVDAILGDLGRLQKQIIEQGRSVERVKRLSESAGKDQGGSESARELRTRELREIAEAAAELEKLTREIERRSKEVEQALDRARARQSETGPDGSSGSSDKPKKMKKPGKPGRARKINDTP